MLTKKIYIFLFLIVSIIYYPTDTNATTEAFSHEKSLAKVNLNNGSYGVSGIEKSVIDSSAAWGVIDFFKDGSLGIAYLKARGVDGFQATTVDIYFARSIDVGKTWTKSLVAEAPAPSIRPNGLIEFTQYRNLSMGQGSSGEIIIAFSKVVFMKQKTGEPVIQNLITKDDFYVEGLYNVLSKDKGKSFSTLSKINIPEILAPNTHYKILNVDSLGLVMSVYGYSDATYQSQAIGILISTNGGKNWDYRKIDLINSPPYGETSLLFSNGTLFAQVRNQGDFLSQYHSKNFGHTWIGPEPITNQGQIPGGAFNSSAGVILVYGSRVEPFGVGAKISRDNGFSYDESTEVSLAWDSPPVTTGGYANAVSDKNNNIFVTYYTMPYSPDYKELWKHSEVRLLKFNANSFYNLFR
jgi:hypothetical protein